MWLKGLAGSAGRSCVCVCVCVRRSSNGLAPQRVGREKPRLTLNNISQLAASLGPRAVCRFTPVSLGIGGPAA